MTRNSPFIMFTTDFFILGCTGWIRESEEYLKRSRAVLSVLTIGRIGPPTRGAQKFTPRMYLLLFLISLTENLLIIVMMLLRRFILNGQMVRSVVLNQDQISNLTRPMKTGIWLVRLIKNWKVSILR